MNTRNVLLVATAEWCYWRRSSLGVIASVVALLLVLASLISTNLRIDTERGARESFQATAEQTFKEQPARHPHRMVHYGHYVFRSPAPLAIVDPGVDAYTGTVLFLEGHRQNSAAFSPRYSAAQAGPLAEITPAFAYQVLLPLLLIIIGFASVAREREGGTAYLLATNSVTPTELWLGKTVALSGIAAIALIPLAISLVFALMQGESLTIVALFFLGYAIYLGCWCTLITALSSWSRRSSISLTFLLVTWLLLCIVAPRFGTTVAGIAIPLDGKIQSDLAVTSALRDVGDGHNANDPAFSRLRSQLLEQYNVETVEELPVNFRGIVAQASEKDLTALLNEFADDRMAQEAKQTQVARVFNVLSPALAIKSFSLSMASTDLSQHHQFLRDAEALRYDFVQKLNSLHAEKLSYADDIRRGSDDRAEQRTRVSSENWRLLKDFPWQPRSLSERLLDSLPQLLILLFWYICSAWLGITGMQRVFKNNDG
ncbi:DUF3526 domain-containing protein [Exilibacterium tricleocarpae]|uniref:DUF3526 domain-containing protein n=1 Tax=Exilibacterium tricleocarpae TaxID=2591008 RepID=A0A545T049_9GAMM|nr:DUF3526 domain-containing protein [Exilibacterium tricleocarpae]TQV70580.1 DUF3526 domain-containing protein [Exilibacterium tricleocarpae]